MTGIYDALGRITSAVYDAAGQPVAHTDPNGFVTTTLPAVGLHG